MNCSQCGKEVEEQAKFCSHCGAKLSTERAEREVNTETTLDSVWDESAEEEIAAADATAQPAMQTNEEANTQMNDMAIIGFTCSFISPLLGCVFGGIGLSRALKRGGKGKGFSIAALAIGAANFFFGMMTGACYSLLLY